MEKLILTLNSKFHSSGVRQQVKSCSENSLVYGARSDNGAFDVRSSPIFRIGGPRVLEKNKSYFLCFFFTLHAFKSVQIIKQSIARQEHQAIEFFTSHGLAGIIAVSKEPIPVKAIENTLPNLKGSQIWTIKNSLIDNSEIRTVRNNKPCDDCLAKFPVGLHLSEERELLDEALCSLEHLQNRVSTFFEEFKPILESAICQLYWCSVAILFARKTISQEEIKALDGIDMLTEESIQAITANDSDSDQLALLHHARNEVMQVSAIIQSISRQAVFGIPPIENAYGLSGRYSLLGYANAYLAIFTLYRFVKSKFQKRSIEGSINNGALERHSIAIRPPDAMKRSDWIAEFRKLSSSSLEERENGDFFQHLLYFSNRLGYKENDVAITAAYQAISLSWTPSWHLSTLFHEFLHSHVKALLAKCYPTTIEQVEQARSNLASNSIPENTQILTYCIFTRTALELTASDDDSVGNYGNHKLPESDTLLSCLRCQNDLIDEVIVHILDFNYFYDTKSNLYMQSIWESWTTLPFLIDRVEEYTLRTLSAIVTGPISNSPISYFDTLYDNLLSSLNGIVGLNKENSSTAKQAWTLLKDEKLREAIRPKFYALLPTIELVKKVFLSPGIQWEFHEQAPVEGEDSDIALATSPCQYSLEELKAPVGFLLGTLKHSLDSAHQNDPQISSYGLWATQALASNYFIANE